MADTAKTAAALPLLAAEHQGMRVDYIGLLWQCRQELEQNAPGYAEMLRQLQEHLRELGQRWYAGDTAVVDELLQLYCIEKDARQALQARAALSAPAQDAQADERAAFEAWFLQAEKWANRGALALDEITSDDYYSPNTQAMWRAWQARAARTQPATPATVDAAATVPESMVLAPDYRGYARLGLGMYLLNHSDAGDPAELIVSIVSEEEAAGRTVGDLKDNAPGTVLQPEQMAVRLRFENVAGLDALERQLRLLRDLHFSGSAPALKEESNG